MPLKRDGVQWAAQLSGVREVSLTGSADAGWWSRRLAPLGLQPAAGDGRAQLRIIGAAGRFAGVAFREASVSVMLADEGSALLLQAFNSSRFFAWCERTFFHTPYLHGDVRAAVDPATVAVGVRGGGEVLRAGMCGEPPAPAGISGWEGRVLLAASEGLQPARCFFARMHGATETRPFGGSDVFTLRRGVPVFEELIESGFAPEEWVVRRSAVHMKSKTYER